MLPTVSYPDEPLDWQLWELLEQDPGPRVPLLTIREAKAAMLLLQVLALGDGVGHEQALALVGRIDRRLPDDEPESPSEGAGQPKSARGQAWDQAVEQARSDAAVTAALKQS